MKEIEELQLILSDDKRVMEVVKNELINLRELYGDDRRTEIVDISEDILPEDLIAPEDMAVTITHTGYIKRNPVALYRSQQRGGKGITGVKNIEEDFVSKLYVASTLDTFLFFTNHGKVFWRKVYQLPLAGRTARGKAIINLLALSEEEKCAAILAIPTFENAESNKSILMVTKLGRIKKTSLSEFSKPISKGKRALTINENDEIIGAYLLNGSDTILIVTQNGMCIHFEESDIREMGRTAAGVKGITLDEGDIVVSALVINSEKSVLIVTENGYGKRSAVNEYRIQRRGGKGLIGIRKSERNGRVIAAKQVDNDDQVILVADSGKMIRIDTDSLRIIGRSTMGVTLFNLEKGEKVVDIDTIEKGRIDEEEDESLIE